MRLIDVSVLKEWIKNWFTKNRFYHPYAKNNNIPITELYDILEQLPSAQPEIIRCKECKHYYYTDNRIPQEQRYVCDLDGDRWKPDSFCSFAERRTDDFSQHMNPPTT